MKIFRASFIVIASVVFLGSAVSRVDGAMHHKYGPNPLKQQLFKRNAEATESTGSREQVLPKVASFELAIKKALEIIGDMGPGSKQYIGRLGTGKGLIVGIESKDKKVRWRLDYDPEKGPHLNVEDWREGKYDGRKFAIPFEGDENSYEEQLMCFDILFLYIKLYAEMNH